MHTDYIRVAGNSIARVESHGSAADPNNRAFNTDYPGSVNLAGLLWREDYMPFGKPLNNSPLKENSLGFTGHVEDRDTGLVYMQARYYDPNIGRFLSNDPVDALTYINGGNIHGFNRYTYANNNPYKFIDPDGRRCESADGTTTCTPEDPDFEAVSFPTPKGWEDFGPGDSTFHKYRFEDSGMGAPQERLKEELVKSPTNDKNAATKSGALNDVGPLHIGSGVDNVTSYKTKQGIVNVTEENHAVGSGFVMRKISEGGNIVTYGEGNSWKQVMPGAGGAAQRFWTKNANRIVERAKK